MNLIRVFPCHTSFTPNDDMVFIGDPPLDRPPADEVHISCAFTWDKSKADRLQKAWSQYYPIVKLDGPAYDNKCNGFIPGMYVKKGVVFTSRGCNNQCPWCLAWKREDKLRTLEVTVGNIIQDNNLLQCPQDHLAKVFDMLRIQRNIQFSGGLDARLVTAKIADDIRSLRIGQVFLACDAKESIKPLREATKKLCLPRDKVRCYVLLKFNPNETISEATERLTDVWNAGAIPFAQLYQPPDKWIDYPLEWTRFQRTWQRPAAMKVVIRDHWRGKSEMNKQLQAKVDKAIDRLLRMSGDLSELQNTFSELIDEAYDDGSEDGYFERSKEVEKESKEVITS